MGKKFSKKTTKKYRVRLSPYQADEIIKSEFTTPRGYPMQKRFIIKPENPNNSGIKVYFNREEQKGE